MMSIKFLRLQVRFILTSSANYALHCLGVCCYVYLALPFPLRIYISQKSIIEKETNNKQSVKNMIKYIIVVFLILQLSPQGNGFRKFPPMVLVPLHLYNHTSLSLLPCEFSLLCDESLSVCSKNVSYNDIYCRLGSHLTH